MPPTAEAVAVGAAPAGNEQRAQQGGNNFIFAICRAVFFWWLFSYMKGGGQNKPAFSTENCFERGEKVDVSFYISTKPYPARELFETTEPVWEVSDYSLVTNDKMSINATYVLPESVKRNQSVYLHVYVARQGYEINPYSEEGFDRNAAFYKIHRLNKYMKKPKEKVEKRLLDKSQQIPETNKKISPTDEETVIANYWMPKLDIAFVDDFGKYKNTTFPQHLKPHVDFDSDHNYYPIIFFNDFWVLRENMIQLNETLYEINIELTLTSIKSWLVQILTQLDETFKMQTTMGLNTEEESDDFKRIFIEGNPIFLCITFAVSLLHSVFDLLAFKNDIGFWRNNKSMEGLSARTILINAGCQVVVLLYLVDNETSFIILASMCIGVFIEFWKITKAMKVSIRWSGHLPLLKIEDRTSYAQSETKAHDETAMRYLSYILYPLVICYAFYNLATNTYKSWYSWVVSSLAGAVYMFGFILMCPQLYLNYKLKSVAHLPWRQLTYKFLNTIIDDLFAFAIKMPLMHRLSVFRDDIVFLIYLYQWYVYGVDKTRVNEFGFSSANPAEPSAIESVDSTSNGPVVAKATSAEGNLRRRIKKGEEEEDDDSDIGVMQEITGDSEEITSESKEITDNKKNK